MTASVTETAKAKINLALHVLGRRDDGYHELDSVVGFAGIGDQLTITVSDELSLNCSGPFGHLVPGGTDNMMLKAWHVLHQFFSATDVLLPKVHVALVKNLPVSSGIGGGSADAAAMLRGLLRIIGQNLSHGEIGALAQGLGADVPVCFFGKACRMQGMGEIITPLNIELPRAIVLANPLLPCATASVFNQLGLRRGQVHQSPLKEDMPNDWRNDLTDAAIAVQPAIKDVLIALQREPTFSSVCMSGSGATCFGLVSSMAQASAAAARISVKHPSWWVRAAELG